MNNVKNNNFNMICAQIQGSEQRVKCGGFYVLQKEDDFYLCGTTKNNMYIPLGKYADKAKSYKVLTMFAWYAYAYSGTASSIVFKVPLEKDADFSYDKYLTFKRNREAKVSNCKYLDVGFFGKFMSSESHNYSKELGCFVNSYHFDIGGYDISVASTVLDGIVVGTGDDKNPFEIAIKDREGNRIGDYYQFYDSADVEEFLMRFYIAKAEKTRLQMHEGVEDELVNVIDFTDENFE